MWTIKIAWSSPWNGICSVSGAFCLFFGNKICQKYLLQSKRKAIQTSRLKKKGPDTMGKYLVLWEVDQTKIPIDPKEQGGGWSLLMAIQITTALS